MLRSSREGRKQAARFHTSSPSHLATPLRFSSLRNGYPSVRATNAKTARGEMGARMAIERKGMVAVEEMAAAPGRTEAAAESETESEGSTQSSAQTEYPSLESSIDGDAAFVSIRPLSLGPSDLESVESNRERHDKAERVDPHPVVLVPILAGHKENPASRDTTEETSHHPLSPLSSPPTSHLSEEQDGAEGTTSRWDGDNYADDASSNAMENMTSISVAQKRGRSERASRYNRFAPRSIEGTSLISHRSRRTVVKSQKQVEADETLALSPASKKRVQDEEATSTPNAEPSVPSMLSNVQREMERKGRPHGQTRASTSNIGMPVSSQKNVSSSLAGPTSDAPVVAKRGPGRPPGTTKLMMIQRRAREAQELATRQAKNASRAVDSQPAEFALQAGQYSSLPTRGVRARAMPTDGEDAASSSDTVLQKSSRTSSSFATTDELLSSTDSLFLPQRRRVGRQVAPQELPTLQARESKGEGGSYSCDITGTEAVEKRARPDQALWKKKVFLSSGLYSDDFKDDMPNRRALAGRGRRQATEALSRRTPRTREARHTPVLPLPTDYGRWLLEEKREFRLPFPVAQQIGDIRGKLAARRKAPPFKHISQNRYVSRAKLPGEILICQCPPDGDCGDSCVNRQTEYLCHPKHCPCGERCTNTYFGKRRAVRTEVKWYGARGFGLKTLEPIAKGGFIDEYRGEVIDFNEAVRRIRDHYKDTGNYYFLMYDAPAGEMLDGGLKGNITRFANHSCDPNCKVQKWLVCGTDEQRSGEFQVALFAERDIAAGEELTYDYGWSAFAAKAVSGAASHAAPEICHCGASNCSGFLGVKKAAATSALASKLLKHVKKRRKRKAVASGSGSKAGVDRVVHPPRLPSRASPTAPVTPTKGSSYIRSLHEDVVNFADSPGMSSISSLSSGSDDGESDREHLEAYAWARPTTMRKPGPIQKRVSSLSRSLFSGKRKRCDTEGGPILVSGAVEEARVATEAAAATNAEPTFQPATKPKQRRNGRDADFEDAPPKKRSRVRERVISVLVPLEAQKKESLIVDGKRERRLSHKAAAERSAERSQRRTPMAMLDPTSSARKNTSNVPPLQSSSRSAAVLDADSARVASASPVQEGIYMSSGRYKGTLKDPFHGLRNAVDATFSIHDYPPDTVFYNRRGEPFDFVEYRKSAMHKKGRKPCVYTREEQAEYQQTQRAKLQQYHRTGKGAQSVQEMATPLKTGPAP